ncbi:sirohydrochlorin chelatase [Kutzneria sp. CA-103260]|uniref:sirohydrochlorin chelatase n=1 Tax=Kutzneria sp. CA-103260 TaxID=2802641 RepID=UPI001BA92D23|nr:sirohydrochlorin chelatase [Kutzneria sp. CA-103260]QUQ69012.1 cobalamin biosynthesis-like protein [Kutzneria sp. CA-103260]
MTLVLAAHGTRDPAGAVVVEEIAAAVRLRLPGIPVSVAYVDVRSPSLTEVLRSVDGPAVVVPAFLAAGYHVRVDVPEQILASGCSSVVVTPALGPSDLVLDAVYDRLVAAGWEHGDGVVLAAAGSSDARAVADVHQAARRLSVLIRSDVQVGFITSAQPSVPEAVAASSAADRCLVSDACPASGSGRVAIASWLLAPGLFHQRLADMGADLVSEPIGAHPRLVDLVVRRALAAGIVDLSTMLVGQ